MGFTIRADEKTLRVPDRLPLLPLRDVVMFPRLSLPLFVGRPGSVAAIEHADSSSKLLFAVAQRRPEIFQPGLDDLFGVGTIVRLIQVVRLPDGTMRILVEGLVRAKVVHVATVSERLEGEFQPLREETVCSKEARRALRAVQAGFAQYAELSRRITEDVLLAVTESDDPLAISFLVPGQMLLKIGVKQELLEAPDAETRLLALTEVLRVEVEALRSERRAVGAPRSLDRRSRRAILSFDTDPDQDQEGGSVASDGESEIEEIAAQIRKARMPRPVEEKAFRELDRLAKMALLAPEATVTRTYLDWLVNVPWRRQTRDRASIGKAEGILEQDHFGLAKVKERILEHLAVLQLCREVRGPVLCLVGPPGVGKTSLGRSVARALNRRFVRMSLGGVRDEAEIRGHRRTYIGSMPGRIVQAMRRAGTLNPVLLLDEVDKLGTDFRGDPAGALLEVLDPEQNAAFNDHYLEVDYNLSKVLFLTTANSIAGIPHALRDRMEVIRLPGYLETEKREIAERFLLPRQREAHGLTASDLTIAPEAMQRIQREYTREAGVRNLERAIASLCRKRARQKVAGELPSVGPVVANELEALLGAPRYTESVLDRGGRIGVATGLAWTEAGGEILVVEVRILPGQGKLILTGKLGETMRESAQAAFSYVRSQAEKLGLDPRFHRQADIHVHVPEGGVPKDGPSAGVTIALALVSALTEKPTRFSVAATGEITLRGKVLPVGGLAEKAVAAMRAGVRTLLIPAGNRKNLQDVPKEIRQSIRIVLVSNVQQVLRHGLARPRRTPSPPLKDKKPLEGIYAA